MLLLLMDNNKNREYLQELSNSNKFSFIYNALINTKPNFEYKIDNFIHGYLL